MPVKVGDLVLSDNGNLGMVIKLVFHPTGYNSVNVEWYPYNYEMGYVGYSISRIKQLRNNFINSNLCQIKLK
jgi:hypothetical protein